MKLTLLEHGLVPVQITDEGNKAVDARELYHSLGSRQEFSNWIKNRIDKYGFVEGEDFLIILSESQGGRPRNDYILKLDVAKELAMVENNEAGRRIRRYFIEVEKRYKNNVEQHIPRTLPEALRAYAVALEDKQALEHQIEQDKPRVLFSKAVETSATSILIGDLAKLLRQNGVDMGQNRLFAWMRKNGYLIKSGERYNTPTQYSMDRGWFEVKVRTINNPDGSVRTTRTTKVTGKGQTYFVNHFLSQPSERGVAHG